MFIKCFAEEAVRLFEWKLGVVVLRRDPALTARSMYYRGDIPGTTNGNKWYLNPAANRNLLKMEDILQQQPFSHDYYKCLWYCYEIDARTKEFFAKYPEIKGYFISTNELNDLDSVTKMFAAFGLAYHEDRLRNLIGIKANASKKKLSDITAVNQVEAEQFSKLCQERISSLTSPHSLDISGFAKRL